MKDFVGNTKIFQFLKFYAMGMIQKVLSDWSEFRPIRCLESQKRISFVIQVVSTFGICFVLLGHTATTKAF